MAKFVHLHTHTHYSLLDGLTRPSDLIKKIKKLGMDSVAITDHGNLYGAIDFYKECKKEGIKPIIGLEAYICNDMSSRTLKDNETYHLTLLAENNIGYQNLIKIVTESNLDGFYYKPRIDFEYLIRNSKGIICLSGCLVSQLSQLLKNDEYEKAKEIAYNYQFIFGDRYFVEIQRHSNNKDQNKVTPLLIKLAKELNIPIVATCDSHYLDKEDRNNHEILLSIQTNKKLSDPKRMTLVDSDIYVASPEEIYEKFKDLPEAIENTTKIADRCSIEIKLGEVKIPPYKLKYKDNYNDELKYLCEQSKLLPSKKEYIDRMNYELDIIGKTNFSSYLLIIADIVNWGKSQGIVFGPGRGSAAGCLLSYLLGITTIDPIKYGLFFERFMNSDRIAPPDIDIDIEDKRRSEVIKYISSTYGEDNVAQIITFGKIYARTGIRDVGRVLEIDLKICDRLAKLVPFQAVRSTDKQIKELLSKNSDLKKEYDSNKELLDIASQLEGTIRHSGVHASGVVISDKLLTEYMPVQLSKDKYKISQFDMNIIENMGLLKMDMLGLRNLSVISECQKLIKEQLGQELDINKIPSDDKKTFKLLQEGKTTSIFQLESDGMKKHLINLKPTHFNDITAMVSLYRPGPMKLIHRYIARKYGREEVRYLHPKLEPILKDTYGIMIYQEQLMAAARELAGLSLSQADILRKAVGKKIKKLLEEQEQIFKEGCKNSGTSKIVTDKFWELVGPFSGYGFNLSHAVSYATIAYQTAYLKANYPIQFMVAEMCSDSKIERITELIKEVKNIGIKVLQPDINFSSIKFSNNGSIIRFSLSAIKGLGEKTAGMIINNGKYDSLQDFAIKNSSRILNKKVIEILGKAGVFDGWTYRNQIIQGSQIVSNYSKFDYKELLPLLVLPEVDKESVEEKTQWEKELIGFRFSKI